MVSLACSALLFDLDGVLIDSTPAVARVWTRWAIEHGFNPKEVVRKAHGRPSLSTIKDYLPGADCEAENREIEQREIDDLEGVTPWPGACELLRSLPPARWTIVTSCTRKLAEVRLKAAGLPQPKFFITATDVLRGKPAPEPYGKGAARLGFSPAQCIVVEDVPAGVCAGKASGATVIGLRTTVSAAELKNAGADWVLDNCASIVFDSSVGQMDRLTLRLTLIADGHPAR